jgi:hypothetical protein
MKKLLLMAAATVALSTVASTAGATSFTDWTFNKTKLTHITDNTYIEKDVQIWVNDVQPLDSAGKSLAVVNSDILNDFVTYATVVPPEGVFPGDQNQTDNGNPFGYQINRHALIENSVFNDAGIGQVNQDVGNNSNQGNVVSAALVFGGNDLVDSEAYVEDLNAFNTAFHVEAVPVTHDAQGNFLANQSAKLTGSFNHLTGVYMGNQNAGNMNSQHNVLSAAVGDAAFTALADAGLDQVNAANTTYDANTVKRDLIENSVNDNTGIVTFNQSVGSMNNQATVINLAVLSSSVGL